MISDSPAILHWEAAIGFLFTRSVLVETILRLAIFPGLAISLLVLCVNLFGDRINDVLNPKLRKT